MSSLNLALDGTDPLSQFARLDEISPLSEIDGNRSSVKTNTRKVGIKFQSWASKRPAILNKYTTSEKLSIVTSFLTGGEISKIKMTTRYILKNMLGTVFVHFSQVKHDNCK